MAPILRVEHVSKHFSGNLAVNDVSMEVEKGEIFGLIGPNGAGKTTLFNCISGFYPCSSGRVYFNDTEITGFKGHKTCEIGICRTFQIVKPFGALTVAENVMIGAFNHTSKGVEAHTEAKKYIQFVGLEDKIDKQAQDLNIGDQRKLEMARALATKPSLLMLDEIMAGLTPTETEMVMQLVRRIRDYGITILMVEHIMAAVMTLSDRMMVLDQGKSLAVGKPQEIASNQTVIESYLGRAYKKHEGADSSGDA